MLRRSPKVPGTPDYVLIYAQALNTCITHARERSCTHTRYHIQGPPYSWSWSWSWTKWDEKTQHRRCHVHNKQDRLCHLYAGAWSWLNKDGGHHRCQICITPHSIAQVIGYYSALEVGDPTTSRNSSDGIQAENRDLTLPGGESIFSKCSRVAVWTISSLRKLTATHLLW